MSEDAFKDKLDDDLGIVEDLQEHNSAMHKEKFNIIMVGALLIALVGFMIYNTFKPKKEVQKEEKVQSVHIDKRDFDPIPEEKFPEPKKVESPKELPMSPFSKPKPKVVMKVTKNAKGSIINFNAPSKEVQKEEKNPNQFDINLYNQALMNQNKPKPVAPVNKEPTMYRGGDYAIAGVSRQNPNLSLAKGSYIECTMVTRIVSSYAGNTKCMTTEDIYSTNGVTLLIEKGSTVTGHYEGGNMENGVERLFVIWDEIRTPNNVVVNLDSHATGPLGATGVDGYVDNHWAMRFGAAILVSIIDVGVESLRDKYTNDNTNTNINYGSGGKDVQNMANVVLNQFINIKPTFYKNHGDVVGIYVEKDLDFSQVYRLK